MTLTADQEARPAGDPNDLVIRLAQRGWRGDVPARTLEEVQSGVQLCWVEVNGVRTEAVVSASVRMHQGFQDVTVEFASGRVDVVYLDQDGRELGVDRAPDGAYAFETTVPRAGHGEQDPRQAWRHLAEAHLHDLTVTGTLARALASALQELPGE